MFNFNVTEIDTTVSEYSPIPAGIYLAEVSDCALEPFDSEKGTGTRVKIAWKLLGGEHDGRLFFHSMIYTYEAKEQTKEAIDKAAIAVTIGQKSLAIVCKACEKYTFESDVSELNGLQCFIKIKVKESTYNGEKRTNNEFVNAYRQDNITGEAIDVNTNKVIDLVTGKTKGDGGNVITTAPKTTPKVNLVKKEPVKETNPFEEAKEVVKEPIPSQTSDAETNIPTQGFKVQFNK